MKQYKVAIAGATGVVGREMMKVLEEREFPVRELVPLASERSEGQNLEFMGGEVTVQPALEGPPCPKFGQRLHNAIFPR